MKINEQVTIKNYETNATTVIDGEGNIAKVGGEEDASLDINPFADDDGLDFGMGDEPDTRSESLRPDGSSDGLDDDLEFDGGLDGAGDFETADTELDADIGGSLDGAPMGDMPVGDETPTDLGLEGEAGLDGEGDPEGALGLEGESEEDPDFQGVIRTVTGANLIYKRKTEDGSYEELWVYNVGKSMRSEVKIRRSILAGTDINPQDTSSEDGSQECVTTTVGNVQFLKISGLPN